MTQQSRQSHRSDRVLGDAARVVLGGCLILAPLAMGGAHPPVNAALSALLVGALGFVVAGRGKQAQLEINAPIVLIGVALLASIAQVVPLPIPVIATLAPKTYDLLTLVGGGHTPAWAAVSLDPPATAHECIKLVSYLSAALLALMLFSNGRRRKQLLTWTAAALGAVVIVGLVHALLGWNSPYNHGPPSRPTILVSSFVNPNHLAAYLGFVGLSTLGLALCNPPPRRWFFAFLASIAGAGVFLTLSRGGIICFVASLIFFAVVALVHSRGSVHHLLLFQLVLAGVAVLAGSAAYSQLVHELWTLGSTNAFDKTEIWRIVPAILNDAPWSGIGRGAFAAVHPHYVTTQHTVTFTHLENEWLQVFVDWGLIVGPILVGLAILSGVQLARRVVTRPECLGVVSAVIFIAVSNIGDFSLTISSLGLTTSVCLAAFIGRKPPDREGRKPMWLQWAVGARGSWVVVGLLLVVVVYCGWSAIAFELPRDESRLARLLAKSDEQTPETEKTARLLVARHPADHMMPLRVGLWHLEGEGGARTALPWINRSMYLAPRFGFSHRLAGRALLRLGAKQQALLEYRLACEYAPSDIDAIAEEVWTRTHSLEALERLAPAREMVRLRVAWALIRRGGPEHAARLLESVNRPLSGKELEVVARAYMDTGDHRRALDNASAAESLNPRRPSPYSLQATALERLGEPTEALRVLEHGLSLISHSTILHRHRALISLRQGNLATAREGARSVLEHALSSDEYARGYELLGRIHEVEGQFAKALREYERAAESSPKTVRFWVQIIRLRQEIGDVMGAQRGLERARRAVGDVGRLQDEMKRLRLVREPD